MSGTTREVDMKEEEDKFSSQIKSHIETQEKLEEERKHLERISWIALSLGKRRETKRTEETSVRPQEKSTIYEYDSIQFQMSFTKSPQTPLSSSLVYAHSLLEAPSSVPSTPPTTSPAPPIAVTCAGTPSFHPVVAVPTSLSGLHH